MPPQAQVTAGEPFDGEVVVRRVLYAVRRPDRLVSSRLRDSSTLSERCTTGISQPCDLCTEIA